MNVIKDDSFGDVGRDVDCCFGSGGRLMSKVFILNWSYIIC